jgi:hypothetical protein
MNSFADFFWAMIVIYFWFMVIWIFIRLFADIFRRRDLSGAMKAIWIVALFVIPFLGAIVYMVTRPHLPEDDVVVAANATQPQQVVATASAADEITKLTGLRDSGVLTPAEFDLAKAKALA